MDAQVKRVNLAAPSLVVSTLCELQHLDMNTVRRREMPTRALMCRPDDYGVEYVINHHMHGNVGKVHRPRAIGQWEDMHAMLSMFCPVEVVSSVAGLPDLVYAANGALTWKECGQKSCIISRMKEPRQDESMHYEKYLQRLGYQIRTLSGSDYFEGEGDALWQPEEMFLWGGWGHRSTVEAYQEISVMLNIPIVLLELVSKEFYHLDTCFCPLGTDIVLYCPYAFSREGNRMIEWMFPEEGRIAVSQTQAMTFCCNAVPFDDDVILPAGDDKVAIALADMGYHIHLVHLDEFKKGGGAAACLKLRHYV